MTLRHSSSVVSRTRDGADARVVHHDIEAVELLECSLHEVFGVGFLAGVGLDADRGAAGVADGPGGLLGAPVSGSS